MLLKVFAAFSIILIVVAGIIYSNGNKKISKIILFIALGFIFITIIMIMEEILMIFWDKSYIFI